MNDNEKNNEFEEFLKSFEESCSFGNDTPALQGKQPEQAQTSATRQTGSRQSSARPYEYPARRKQRRRKPGLYLSPKRKAPKKRGRRRMTVITVILVAVMILSIAMIIKSCGSAGDVLKGTWDIDGVTMYQFDGNGNGSLVLPSHTYPFTYEIEDDELRIDFESETANDTVYTFTVKNGVLTMTNGEGSTGRTFELKKVSD